MRPASSGDGTPVPFLTLCFQNLHKFLLFTNNGHAWTSMTITACIKNISKMTNMGGVIHTSKLDNMSSQAVRFFGVDLYGDFLDIECLLAPCWPQGVPV